MTNPGVPRRTIQILGLVLGCGIALVATAPQGISPDAEFVPELGGGSRGPGGGRGGPGALPDLPDDGRGIIIVMRRDPPRRSFFDDLLDSLGFSRTPLFTPPRLPDLFDFDVPLRIPNPDAVPPTDDGSLFGFPFGVPSVDPDELPPNFNNSTHEVKTVNGSQFEVNQTVTKTTGEDGVFFTRVHVVRLRPDGDQGAVRGQGLTPEKAGEPLDPTTPQDKLDVPLKDPGVPQEDPSVNRVVEPYEDFEVGV